MAARRRADTLTYSYDARGRWIASSYAPALRRGLFRAPGVLQRTLLTYNEADSLVQRVAVRRDLRGDISRDTLRLIRDRPGAPSHLREHRPARAYLRADELLAYDSLGRHVRTVRFEHDGTRRVRTASASVAYLSSPRRIVRRDTAFDRSSLLPTRLTVDSCVYTADGLTRTCYRLDEGLASSFRAPRRWTRRREEVLAVDTCGERVRHRIRRDAREEFAYDYELLNGDCSRPVRARVRGRDGVWRQLTYHRLENTRGKLRELLVREDGRDLSAEWFEVEYW